MTTTPRQTGARATRTPAPAPGSPIKPASTATSTTMTSTSPSSSWTMKMSWTKPPLSLNQRLHHHAKGRVTKEIREETFLRAKFHKLPKGCERVRVTLIYRPIDLGRRRDAINLTPTLKAIEDGLVDYGLVPDDTPQYIDPVMPLILPPLEGQKIAQIVVLVERLA